MPILTDQERCGTVLAGRYRLESILGRGGMGVVFRGHDGARPVAVKLLRPEYASDQSLAKRFVREANAAAKIRHPNVVEVRDLGIDPDGTIYQVLQLLEGQTLRDHLSAKATMSVPLTLEVLLPVMSAVAAAHALGIVHRDLKPDNIYLARQSDGSIVPKVLDFGIAKLLDGQASFATNTGSVMGTPAYMPPEQAMGAKDQGPLIDVWAIGVILYECITGKTPFDSPNVVHVMYRILSEKAERLDAIDSAIPAGIASAVAQALERELPARHPSMDAFSRALREGALASGLVLPEPSRSAIVTPLSLSPPPITEQAPPSSEPGELSVLLEVDLPDRKFPQDAGTGVPTPPRVFVKNTMVGSSRSVASQAVLSSAPTSPSPSLRLPVAIAMALALTLGAVYLFTRAPEPDLRASDPADTIEAPAPAPEMPAAVAAPPATIVAIDSTPDIAPEVAPEVTLPPPTHVRRSEARHDTPASTVQTAEPEPSAPTEHRHELPGVVEW